MEAPAVDIELVVAVAELVRRDEQPMAIADQLGVDVDLVYACFRAIVAVLPEPRHIFASIDELRQALEASDT